MAPRGRQTIVQRIALDGGKQIEAELAQLGDAGVRAFKALKEAVDANNGPMARLAIHVAAVKASFNETFVAGAALGNTIGTLGTRIAALVGVVGLAGAAGAMVAFAKATANAGEEASKQSQILGTTVTQYKQLSALASLADVSSTELTKAFNKLNSAIAGNVTQLKQAEPQLGQFFTTLQNGIHRSTLVTKQNLEELNKIAQGATQEVLPRVGEFFNIFAGSVRRSVLVTKENVTDLTKYVLQQRAALSGKELTPSQLLQSLGIPTIDAITGQVRPAFEVLRDLAGAFEKMPDGARKAAIAMALFGERIGSQLIPLLNGGKHAIEELSDTLRDFGVGVDPVVDKLKAKLAETFNDTIKTISIGLSLLRDAFGNRFIQEAMQPVEGFLAALRASHGDMRDRFEEMGATVGSFAADVLRLMTPLRQVDGSITFLSPQNASEQQKAILAIRDALLTVVEVGRVAFTVIKFGIDQVISVADVAAAAINAIFGTELTGAGLLLAVVIAKVTGLLGLFTGAVTFALRFLGLMITSLNLLRFSLANALPASIVALFTSLGGVLRIVGFVVAGLATAFGGIPALLLVLASVIAFFWKDFAEVAKQGWAAFKQHALEAIPSWSEIWTQIKKIVADAVNGIVAKAKDIWNSMLGDTRSKWGIIEQSVEHAWEGMNEDAEESGKKVEGILDRLIRKAKELQQAFIEAMQATPAEGGGTGFARGGMVRGAGGPTTDSIPAWLSSGEFVVRAAAVRKYGSGLLNAINGMRLAGSRMSKMGLPTFAMGGLVDGALRLPAPSTVTLPHPGIPGKSFDLHIGGQTFGGLLAPDEVAAQLQNFVINANTRSAGRKPGWYGDRR